MFKKLALSALLLSLVSVPLLAQQATTPDAPATNRTDRPNRAMRMQQDVDPATRARKMTDRMTKELALDEATSKKVYNLMLARADKMEALRKNSDDRRAKMQAMKAEADAFKSDLKGILTPDQFAKFESMQQNRMRHGRGRPDTMKENKENSDKK